jgi:subtilisin family serine protease
MREYNVILKEGIDYDEFWNDMESDTDGGKLYIPNRAVQFTNERPASLRQCWYVLTEEEVEMLKADERVFDVEIPPEHRADIVMVPNAVQVGNFDKTTSSTGDALNWGMIRCNSTLNTYSGSNSTTLDYTYTLTGEGVDVVIQDSGLQVNHPEFNDEAGNSRVQQINWYTESGIAGTQSANHYRDFDGHGTHVAGTVAGLTYGWAKRARVYSQKLAGLEGSGDSGTGISITNAFDTIKLWHRNKAVDPNTGYKRPTVVNMSWGYLTGYNSVTSLTYRGVSYTDGSTTGSELYRQNTYGLMNVSGFNIGTTFATNVRISSVDTDVDELIAEGVHVCIAAGNRGHKIDLPAGTDYDNFVVTNASTTYYHRGSSPSSVNALNVGNIDSLNTVDALDQKAISSETGPGVDIYAPGTNIMSACSNTNAFSAQNYYLNASFRQVNISGTSMASPQVAGMAALLLEINPGAAPSQVKASLLANAGTQIYTSIPVIPTNTFSVSNSGASAYIINTASNPSITLIKGETYTFNVNASGHPFWIKTAQTTGTGNQYNSGVTNNGTESGTITFVVPMDAPTALYYICQYHSSMTGVITVSDPSSDWSNRRSLYGGEPIVLYNRFNQDVSTTVSGEFVKFANIGV